MVGPNYNNDATGPGTPGTTSVVEYAAGNSCSTSAGAGFVIKTYYQGASVVVSDQGFSFLVP